MMGTAGETGCAMTDPLETVLSQLDRWRHLPKYRLEQHVDVLFGLTLPTVIGRKFSICPDELHVVPELPIAKGDGTRRSWNVDFAVFSRNAERVFLVELKTDAKSIDKEQLNRMRAIGTLGDLVCEILCIAASSDEKRKYIHLICELHRAGAMSVPEKLKELDLSGESLRGFTEALECCEARNPACKPQLALVYPSHESVTVDTTGFDCFDFEDYAQAITSTLENTFARYLRRWRSQAGEAKPNWR